MRLIDADAVLALIRPDSAEDIESAMLISDAKRMIRNVINAQPTVDAVLVKQTCESCKWYEFFNGACPNGLSDYFADFAGKDFKILRAKWEEKEESGNDKL